MLRSGGRLATVAAGGSAPFAATRRGLATAECEARGRSLDRVAELVTQGAVRLPEIVEYPLARAAEAHRVSEARHLRGKLVLRVR